MTDSAIAVGEVTIGQNEVADILRPRTDEKLVGLKRLVTRSWLDKRDKVEVYSRLVRIQKLTGLEQNDAACLRIKDLIRDARDEQFLVALEAGPFASYDLALYDDFVTGVEELARELGCPPNLGSSLKGLELAPKDTQSPYAGTALAWDTPRY